MSGAQPLKNKLYSQTVIFCVKVAENGAGEASTVPQQQRGGPVAVQAGRHVQQLQAGVGGENGKLEVAAKPGGAVQFGCGDHLTAPVSHTGTVSFQSSERCLFLINTVILCIGRPQMILIIKLLYRATTPAPCWLWMTSWAGSGAGTR